MKDLLLDLEALRDEVGRSIEAGPCRREEVRRTLAPWRRAASWIVGVLGVAAVLVLGYSARWKSTPIPPAQRLSIELGMPGRLPGTDVPIALSPDGTLLAFVARTNGEAPQLYVRRLDQLTATPLSGTEGASTPCFSPDGQWLAFFADMKLKKVPVTGGAVVTLADAPEPRGAWWAEDGTIVFAPHNRRGLMRVSSVGGQAQPVTTLREGEITHRFPQVLPGGAGNPLYSQHGGEDRDGVDAGRPAPAFRRAHDRPARRLLRALCGQRPHLYLQEDTLFAMPFDLRRLTATGPAARTIDGIQSDLGRGSAQLTLSQTGTMAYIAGRNTFDARPDRVDGPHRGAYHASRRAG